MPSGDVLVLAEAAFHCEPDPELDTLAHGLPEISSKIDRGWHEQGPVATREQ